MSKVKEALSLDTQEVQNIVNSLNRERPKNLIKQYQNDLAEWVIPKFPHLGTQAIADSLATDPLPAFKEVVKSMSLLELQEVIEYETPTGIGQYIASGIVNAADFLTLGLVGKAMYGLLEWYFGFKVIKISSKKLEPLKRALVYIALLELVGENK